jgi:ribosomal protein S18 acetylase RimI-like enzyme
VLGDTPLTFERDGYVLTTDRTRIPVDQALELLRTTWWAKELTGERLQRAMENSVCFAVLRDDTIVGFARSVTDLATYAYLCDVVVNPEHGRRGLAQWIVQTWLSHPQLQGLRRYSLMSTDAKGLYAKFGFNGEEREHYMSLKPGQRSEV